MIILVIIFRVLFVLIGICGLVDFGHGTLSDIIVNHFDVSRIAAATIVSMMVGICGALSFLRPKK